MIPSSLAFGAKGIDEMVPPNADLIFDIELLEVK
jgi:FKBP-type peptidyl-prolyl cis-trans isomerase